MDDPKVKVKVIEFRKRDYRVEHCVEVAVNKCSAPAVAIDVDKDANFDLLIDTGTVLIVAYEQLRDLAKGYGTARRKPATHRELDQAQEALFKGQDHGMVRYTEFVQALRNDQVRIDFLGGCLFSLEVYFIGKDGRKVYVELNDGNYRFENPSAKIVVTQFRLAEAEADGITIIVDEPAKIRAIQSPLNALYRRILETPASAPSEKCGPGIPDLLDLPPTFDNRQW